VHNTQTILAFVERGLGVSVLPELFHTSDRSYAALPIGDLPLKRSLYILKRRSVSLSPTDLRVIAAIKDAVKGLGVN
jgi:DNA-binding transcriptional LysR family regulator